MGHPGLPPANGRDPRATKAPVLTDDRASTAAVAAATRGRGGGMGGALPELGEDSGDEDEGPSALAGGASLALNDAMAYLPELSAELPTPAAARRA